MEALIIIASILWVVIPIILKYKQRDAREAAAREQAKQRALQTRQGQPQGAQRQTLSQAQWQQMQAAQRRPNAIGAYVPQEGESLGEGDLTRDSRMPIQPSETMPGATVGSSLTEIRSSTKHAVEASSLTGHAHEETSMTGEEEECPPELKRAEIAPARSLSDTGVMHISSLDIYALQNSIVMAEILGPCVALREAE